MAQPDGYDIMIQQFLRNLEATPQAVETGFARQREERLIGEERTDRDRLIGEERADRDRVTQDNRAEDQRIRNEQREQQLTDAATNIRIRQIERLTELGAFIDPTGDQFSLVRTIMDGLSGTPAERGQALLDATISGSMMLEDGTEVNVNSLLSELEATARSTKLNENWLDTTVQGIIQFLHDPAGDPELKRAYLERSVLPSSMFSESMKDSMLMAAGVGDPELRARMIAERSLLDAQIEGQRAATALTTAQAARTWFDLSERRRLSEIEYETAVAELATRVQNNEITATTAFAQFGYVPEGQAGEAFARRMGYGSAEMAREAGRHIWKRLQNSEDIHHRLLRLNEDLVGRQVARADIDNAIREIERDSMAVYKAIEDQANLAAFAFGAAALGDTHTLQVLEAMSVDERYMDTLGILDFEGLRGLASEIAEDAEQARAHEKAGRQLEIASGELAFTQDLDSYVESIGMRFLYSSTSLRADGSTDLAEDVNQFVDSMPRNQIGNLGVTDDVLRERLMGAAHRARAAQGREMGAVMMDMLLATPPDPENPAAVALWKDQLVAAGLSVGYDDAFLQSVTANVGDSSALRFQRTRVEIAEIVSRSANLNANTRNTIARMGLIPYEQNLMYAQTRLTNANAALTEFELEQLMVEELEDGSFQMTKELHDMLLADANALASAANDMIRSSICTLTTDAPFAQSTFNEGNEDCVAARDTLQEATQNIRLLNLATITGDGSYLFDQSRIMDPTLQSQDTYNAFRNLEDFNWDAYESLDVDGMTGLYAAVSRGQLDPTDAAAVNRAMADAIAEMEAENRQAHDAERGLATLNVGSNDWMRMAPGQREGLIATTPEWQRLVREVMEGREIGDAEARRLTRQFGFLMPGVAGGFSDNLAHLGAIENQPEFRETLNRHVAEARRLREMAPQSDDEFLPAVGRDGAAFTPPRSLNPISLLQRAETNPASRFPVSENRSVTTEQYMPEEAFEVLFEALIQAESTGMHFGGPGTVAGPDELTTSHRGAAGISQIMPTTGPQPGFGVRPLANATEEEYLRFGRDYLAGLINYYKGDILKGVAAYNHGPGNVDKTIAARGVQWYTMLPPETVDYVKSIANRVNPQAGTQAQR